jgi:hypothetical protein
MVGHYVHASGLGLGRHSIYIIYYKIAQMKAIQFQFSFKNQQYRNVVCEVFKKSYGYPSHAPFTKEWPSILMIPHDLRTPTYAPWILEITCHSESQVISVLETFYPTDPMYDGPVNYFPVQTIPEAV